MNKTIFLILVLGLVLFSSNSTAQEELNVFVPAAILMDGQTGEVHFGKNEHARRSIASVVKVMTLLLVAEEVQAKNIKLNDVVTASGNAASRGGTQIRLQAGDEFSVEDLLHATAMVSANDGAVALAEFIAGSEREFARLMTQRANSLGLENTSFVDSTGLLPQSSGNYSTAYEIAQLMRFAMQNPIFANVVGTREYELKPQGRTLRNSNDLLYDFSGTDGGKTGLTTPAGHTLVASVSQNGWRLITVVLGAQTREKRFEQAREILEWGFANLEVVLRQGEDVVEIPVREGSRSRVTLVPKTDLKTILAGGQGRDFQRDLEVPESVEAPIRQGEKIGRLIMHKGEVELPVDLVAKTNVGRANVFTFLFRWIFELLGIG